MMQCITNFGDALVSSYSANALNQYTRRTVPGTAQVRGFADSGADVTVNGNGTWRSGEYFYGGDDADNAAFPIFKELAIEAVVPAQTPDDCDEAAAVTGRVFVAQSPERFTYDADGNMLTDGRFRYTWNAENRLVRAQELVAPTNRHPYTVSYAYDHRGRMVFKRITQNDGQDSLVKSISYLWDGWNIIREIQWPVETLATSHCPLVTDYVWGLDLDGTLQGAGGVGGLLAVVRDGETYFPTYDANGNVSEYVSAADGSIAAHYDYSPFGKTLIETGDLASSFTHRFSTKPWCPVTGLYEYQMRKYRPGIGRWLSRDPLEGTPLICLVVNLLSRLRIAQIMQPQHLDDAKYSFILNNINLIDVLGEQPRDKYYGLPPRFWHWYHKNIKKKGDPDLTEDEAREWHDEWEKRGAPGADSKDKRGKDTRGKDTRRGKDSDNREDAECESPEMEEGEAQDHFADEDANGQDSSSDNQDDNQAGTGSQKAFLVLIFVILGVLGGFGNGAPSNSSYPGYSF